MISSDDRRRIAALATGAVLAFGVSACGRSDDDEPPPRSEIVKGTVALVGAQKVTNADLQHQIKILRASQPAPVNADLYPAAKRTIKNHRLAIRNQALSLLLHEKAIEADAAEHGIEVSFAEARRRWNTVTGQQFETDRQLSHFLSGQSERDMIDQLRLQMLTERLHAKIAREAGGGKEGEAAVRKFEDNFTERWQGRIVCSDKKVKVTACEDDTEKTGSK